MTSRACDDPVAASCAVVPAQADGQRRDGVSARAAELDVIRRHSAVFTFMSDAVVVLTLDGLTVDVNPAAERLFGYSRDILIEDLPTSRSDSDAARRRFEAIKARVLVDRVWQGDVSFQRGGDGSRRTCLTTVTGVYDDSGETLVGLIGINRDVTDERRTQRALAEAELRWRMTLDNAPIGIALVALDGHWLRVNNALCDMLGYTEAELVACTFQDITHPDDLDADLTRLSEVVAGTRERYSLDKRYRHGRDGHWVWARLSVALAWDEHGEPLHFVSQIEDITERRAAGERLSAIIDSASDAFVTCDSTGTVTEWNAAAERCFGWTKTEALGQELAELVVPPAQRIAHRAGLARVMSGGDVHITGQRLELEAQRRGGETFPAELTLWRTPAGASWDYHGFIRDISDRRAAESNARASATRSAAIVAAQLDISQVELTPSKVMLHIAEQAAKLTDADGAVIELRERDVGSDDMVYRAVTGQVRDYLGLRLPVASSLSGMCVESGQPLICHDTEIDPRVNVDACRRLDIRSMMLTPLRRNSEIVGVLKVSSRLPHAFTSAHIELLDVLAAPFSSAMANAWALEASTQQALTDPLTGLANRAHALHELGRALDRQRRSGTFTAVAFVDLDGFKAVNDTHGHGVGDELLIAVANRLRTRVRGADTPARYGGDEFLVVYDGLVNEGDADVLGSRLRDELAGSYDLGPHRVGIGASVGIAIAVNAIGPVDLLQAADRAMYEAKHAGGGAHVTRVLG